MWSVFMIRVHCGNLVTVNDSYDPPYLIWNWYLMVPPYHIQNRYHIAPHVFMVPPTMYDLMVSPLPYIEQVSYGPPTCMYGHPTCKIWFFSGQLQKRSTVWPNRSLYYLWRTGTILIQGYTMNVTHISFISFSCSWDGGGFECVGLFTITLKKMQLNDQGDEITVQWFSHKRIQY